MNIFSSLWKWMSGKKRTICVIYWSVLIPAMAIIWPDGFDTPFAVVFDKIVLITGLILSAAGLGHAAIKSDNTTPTDVVNEVVNAEPIQEPEIKEEVK